MQEWGTDKPGRRFVPFLRRPQEILPKEPPPKIPFTEYLHILETYAVKWDTEKVARDTLQNFFDANGYTLDGIKTSAEESEQGHKVTISGATGYDYRYLLHTGGTSKAEDARAAGGFGEGAKVAALICLRDLGAKEVVYETEGKKVTFYLDDIHDTHYPNPVRGLFVRVTEGGDKKGSSFEATFPYGAVADIFVKARDLFYHKDNPDFHNPTVENSAGGFKIHVGRGGNLYEAGQRRHYHEWDNSIRWNNVEDVTIWTKEKTFQPDRDRGDIDKHQIEKKAIAKIVGQMEPEEIKRVIEQNRDLWHKTEPFGLGKDLLQQMVNAYKKTGESLHFPDQYVAATLFMQDYIKSSLEEAGYIICDYSLRGIGMISAAEKFNQLQEHYRLEPTEAEAKRLDLLRKAVNEFLGQGVEEELFLFSKDNERNIVHGQYSTGRIWISQETLHGDFAGALSTLLHERDHKSGTDQSAEFSYALTDTLKKVIDAFLKKADIAKSLAQDWDSIAFEKLTKGGEIN